MFIGHHFSKIQINGTIAKTNNVHSIKLSLSSGPCGLLRLLIQPRSAFGLFYSETREKQNSDSLCFIIVYFQPLQC